MRRGDLLLAVLAAAQGQAYQPVQIQKAIFLVTRNIPTLVTDGPGFNFEAYDYGPYDRNVYVEADLLSEAGDVVTAPSSQGRWQTYAASEQGIRRGQDILAKLTPPRQKYIKEVSNWVRLLSFGTLVKAIYSKYPEMRENSVFRD